MANLTKCLTSISPDLRLGSPPGGRLLAVVLCVTLVFGSVFPGFAFAGEGDSEGVGTAPEVEVPVPADLDPGGEETDLVEVPASGGDEEGGSAVEAEVEVDAEAPSMEEVTSAVVEEPAEAQAPESVGGPGPATSAPEPEPVQQKAPQRAVSEPVANQSIVAPKQKTRQQAPPPDATSSEAALSSEPSEEDAPSAPSPQTAASGPAGDHGRHRVGKNSYVVQPGDCLSHIAARFLLPAGADWPAIARKVAHLWRINKDRIGSGDPDIIYVGTVLKLR